MFKRSGASYSLWPEQRPRRGRPLKFAAGSFVLGVVCATAYGTLFNFTAPATGQDLRVQRVVEPVPIVGAAPAPTAAAVPLPRPADPESRSARTRAAAAKVTLPLIGTSSARPDTATDGRGDDGFSGEVRLTGPDAGSDSLPSLLGDDSEPSRMPAARQAPPQAPARKADAAPGSKAEGAGSANAAGAAVTGPVLRAAGARADAVKTSEPPLKPAAEERERARAPSVEQAPAATAERAAKIETRTERRGIVVLKRHEQPTLLAGGSDAPEPVPSSVQDTKAKPAEPAAPSEARAKRHGYVVLKKREQKQQTRLARAEDAPAPEPAARTTRSTKAKTAAVSERPAKPRKSIARAKPEKPTRYAARSRSKREEPGRRVAGRRQDRLSSMIAQATQAFRAYTGGHGFSLSGGF